MVPDGVTWHTSVEEARADGWREPYEGGCSLPHWDCRGRIYGKKPGNHRIFRCYKHAKAQTQEDVGGENIRPT